MVRNDVNINIVMEKGNRKKGKNSWTVVFIFPLIWGITGLIQGEGFFPYILKNIWALIILAGIVLILLLIFFFFYGNDRNRNY